MSKRFQGLLRCALRGRRCKTPAALLITKKKKKKRKKRKGRKNYGDIALNQIVFGPIVMIGVRIELCVPIRSDADKNRIDHFWPTFVSPLHVIFVLAASFCMVY